MPGRIDLRRYLRKSRLTAEDRRKLKYVIKILGKDICFKKYQQSKIETKIDAHFPTDGT